MRRNSRYILNNLVQPTNISPVKNTDVWDPVKKRGIYILNLNIYSLLPKIEELREIPVFTKASVIGIPESKLDNSIEDKETYIAGYSILRCDKNRHGGGVACYIENDLCFYRPPGQDSFLEILTNYLNSLDIG